MKNEDNDIISIFFLPAMVTLCILIISLPRYKPYPAKRYDELEKLAQKIVTESGIDYSLIAENTDIWHKLSYPNEGVISLQYGYNSSEDDYRAVWIELTLSKGHYDIISKNRHLTKKQYENRQALNFVITGIITYLILFLLNFYVIQPILDD